MEKLKLYDPNWMGWRVLKRDKVETDAEQLVCGENYLALTWGNLLKALLLGYSARYRIWPDSACGDSYFKRFGKVRRPK